MAIAAIANVNPTILWQQRDARDPLGVWGGFILLTGDATGGGMRAIFQVPAGREGQYVFTAYSASISQVSGTLVAMSSRITLFANMPNIQSAAGIQGYEMRRVGAGESGGQHNGSANFVSNVGGLTQQLIGPLDRFILLYDPTPGGNVLQIADLQVTLNTDTIPLEFSMYGYFWDRAVLTTPGGLRHPGSN